MALLTVSQLWCVLWPMTVDNTLMVAGGLVLAGGRARLHLWHTAQDQIWRTCLIDHPGTCRQRLLTNRRRGRGSRSLG